MVAALPPLSACVLFAVAVRSLRENLQQRAGLFPDNAERAFPTCLFSAGFRKNNAANALRMHFEALCGSRADFCGYPLLRPSLSVHCRMRDAPCEKSRVAFCRLLRALLRYSVSRLVPACREPGRSAPVPVSDGIGRDALPLAVPCWEDGKNRAFYLSSANIVRCLDFNAGKVTFMPAL